MPFMPFSDDPEFDYLSYNEQYKFFLWQIPNRDPDLEVVVIEIARRLYSDHQLSTEAIDKAAVLPLELNRLINISRRRDYPPWLNFGKATSLPSQPAFATAAENPHGQLPNLLQYFCGNNSCLVGYCTIHGVSSIPSLWTESEMQTLRVILDYSPDTLPCDAAIVCRKPCREIFRYRQDPPKIKKSAAKTKHLIYKRG